ncbi:LLM class flavin-dependent oxidoreductase [Streptomyces sulphureus]|uniref:LLM class flavin-dependent oxidoreductase n=1 Tax=Streptomyces sulphureus TaxID=47758 RepID=UPI00036B3C71|nr:LLM class flavin-dependent oxidoreductase [Streptomyces sulphureus]
MGTYARTVEEPVNTARFGVYVPQFKTDVDRVRTLAQAAEESGYESFWLMDHLSTPGAPPCDTLESWTLLTALAASTSRIRLGHLVGCNPLRPPALLAKMAATVDRISAGRLELGLGWGSVEEELTQFGLGGASRRERSEQLGETLRILEAMWTGTPFDHLGKHFTLRGAYGLPVPVQGRIPIHLGGAGRELTMPLVAAYADWWNCLGAGRHRLEELAPLRGGARISAQYAVGLARTSAEREEVAAATRRRMPEVAWGRPLVGTPDELVEQFRAERARGVELFVVRFHDFDRAETIELFAREVAAVVRGRGSAAE